MTNFRNRKWKMF